MCSDMEFSNIVGNYINTRQAFESPAHWAHIRVEIEDLGNNKLQSRSYYYYEWEISGPYYRCTNHEYQQITPTQVVFDNYDLDWNKLFTFEFDWDGEFWVSNAKDNCIINGTRVVSHLKFSQDLLLSQEAGYDVETDKLIWGREGGVFKFNKILSDNNLLAL
jgi:hypothetical protein